MKQRLLFAIMAIALCFPAWSQLRGDLNDDGNVDVTDVSIMIDMVLGKQEPNLTLGDLDGNGQVDVSDVSMVIDIVLGKEPGGGEEPATMTFTANGVSFTMIFVEGGTFSMGGTPEQGSDVQDDELPVHQVTLSNFRIGETEVTQELWMAVMGSNPSMCCSANNPSYSDDFQRPVEQVTWNDCQEFISKLNELTGETFRLPTEAEWEFAARGGNKSKGYMYAGSNNLEEVALYWGNIPSQQPHTEGYGAQAVGLKKPNELGLYDMSGNVWEWCYDWYGSYTSAAQTNPTGPSTSKWHVLRGGSWSSSKPERCRVARRSRSSGSLSDLGLRLAM